MNEFLKGSSKMARKSFRHGKNQIVFYILINILRISVMSFKRGKEREHTKIKKSNLSP